MVPLLPLAWLVGTWGALRPLYHTAIHQVRLELDNEPDRRFIFIAIVGITRHFNSRHRSAPLDILSSRAMLTCRPTAGCG